jgi:hypothetical protein
MAADIYDIFTKTKLKNSPTLEERFEMCYSKTLSDGECKCDICETKRDIAAQLISKGSNLLFQYMKESRNSIYMLDLLEVLIIASKHVNNRIQSKKEPPNEPA